ncbi:leucine-rich repeat protein [Histomonas meleagridis]|uniref:leucine-rich repeat protein n=1 Tax=Histomonas meleagridis TaxID=135588 RepID=UPI00355AAEE0|nr:leucine-rich repeat protein [Histomonas meleagridis]KAH0802747.1 leucine-rich repeat protein [Histomonas meleagridis]
MDHNGLEEVSFECATHVDDYAFKNCVSLQKAYLPAVKYVGNQAFYGCTSLIDLTIGSNVETIKEKAFAYCSSLQKVALRAFQFLNEAKGLFMNCSNLKTIIMPKLSYVTPSFLDIFENCTSLTRIDLPSTEPNEFNDSAFNSTGIPRIVKNGVEAIPINLCLPYKVDYKNYGDDVWKGIFGNPPDNYFEICLESQDEQISTTKQVILYSLIALAVIVVIVIGVIVALKIYRTKKRQEEEALQLYITVTDDEDEDY